MHLEAPGSRPLPAPCLFPDTPLFLHDLLSSFCSVDIPGTHSCYRPSQLQGHSATGRSISMKISNEAIGNRTCDHPFIIMCYANYIRTPLFRTLVVRMANHSERFGPSGKSVKYSSKLNCLEITGYRIEYSAALWLLELPIRRGRNV